MSIRKSNTSIIKFYLVIFISAIAVYANTFNHNFVLDDEIVFTGNKYVQEGITAIPNIISHGFLYGFNEKNDQSYRPLVTVAFAIEKSLFGNNSKAIHKMNVLYYAILCCLLFAFLNLLFNKNKPWIAFWVSLLFVLHPIHTEVVANIKSRDEIFHALFILLSMIYALKYVDNKLIKNIVWSLVYFLLALLSKEMAVTYIAILPLTLWFFRELSLKKIATITGYFAGVLFLYFLLRNFVLDTITFDEEMTILNNSLTAADSFSEQLATTFYIFSHYIQLLFFPSPLAWDYSFPHFKVVSFLNLRVIITVVSLVALGVIAFIGLFRKNKFAYCFLFFIVSFSVVSNFFILIGSTLGERFLFFPSIAFCLFVVWSAQKLVAAIKIQNKIALPIILIAICLGYSFKTFDRNKDWENNNSLFVSGVEATPNNSRAVGALGSMNRELAEQSRNQQQQISYYKKAIANYKRSVELLPTNFDSYYNLGVIYQAMNQQGNAKLAFEKTIEISPNMPNALNNLGVIYFNNKEFLKAKEYFEKCLEINSKFQKANANLGAVYHNLGQIELARKYYTIALQLEPNDQNLRNNLSRL